LIPPKIYTELGTNQTQNTQVTINQ